MGNSMGIKLVYQCDINPKQYGYNCNCRVVYAHIKVHDIKKRANTLIKDFSDTCWISKLDPATAFAYKERVEQTALDLIKNVLEKVDNTITEKFGEIIVSSSARDILGLHYNHQTFPLAELWKEKNLGNPGFDFHTQTPTNLIAFGEAKYSSTSNSYGKAIQQIDDFIINGKDKKELSDLRNFASIFAQKNMHESGLRVFVAAFSLYPHDNERLLKQIMKNKHLSNLLKYPELYIIGVET